jgi:hypothetical protein
MDERAIVLTDKHLYKLDPKKNFHIKKTGIPIDHIVGLSVTTGREQLIVVHFASDHDLIFYMQTKLDRVGEFVGHVAKLLRRKYVIKNLLLRLISIVLASFLFSSNFFVDVQRYVSAQLDKNKHVINVIPGGVDKVEFRKGSNKNITLMLPNSE